MSKLFIIVCKYSKNPPIIKYGLILNEEVKKMAMYNILGLYLRSSLLLDDMFFQKRWQQTVLINFCNSSLETDSKYLIGVEEQIVNSINNKIGSKPAPIINAQRLE